MIRNHVKCNFKMKKYRFYFILIILLLAGFPQKSHAQGNNCLYRGIKVDSNNFPGLIKTLDSLVLQTPNSELLKLIDCLILVDSTNPKLYKYKANVLAMLNGRDSSYIPFLRRCIDMGYDVSTSYYNIAAFYMNYQDEKMAELSSATVSLSTQDRVKLLTLAEDNMWHAVEPNDNIKWDALVAIGDIQNIKSELLGKSSPKISRKMDSLEIITHFRDCGEFGGHFEQIQVSKMGNKFIATFFADSIYCMNELARNSPNAKYNGIRKTLTKGRLNKFLNGFETYEEDKYLLSNAPKDISVIQGKKVISKHIIGPWPYYLNFRKKLFGF